MKHASLAVLATAGLLTTLPAVASDADLKVLREEIAQMKNAYEQRIKALESRLEKAETTAVKAEVSATQAQASAQQATARPAPANAFNPEISLILQGRYKDMKEVPERTITGFWPAAGHDHAGGSDEANLRGFSLDHSELVFGANIDPWWRGQLMLGVRDEEVEVEEAWVQTLGIGHGIGLKGGRVRSGIGYLNEQHPHAWDFSDAPLMYTVMFGEHASYAQDGLQLKWVAPTETFIELGAEFGRGAHECAGHGLGRTFEEHAHALTRLDARGFALRHVELQPQRVETQHTRDRRARGEVVTRSGEPRGDDSVERRAHLRVFELLARERDVGATLRERRAPVLHFLERVLQRQRVDRGREHAHLIGSRAVGAAAREGSAADDVATADHHGDAHPQLLHGVHLGRDPIQHRCV